MCMCKYSSIIIVLCFFSSLDVCIVGLQFIKLLNGARFLLTFLFV